MPLALCQRLPLALCQRPPRRREAAVCQNYHRRLPLLSEKQPFANIFRDAGEKQTFANIITIHARLGRARFTLRPSPAPHSVTPPHPPGCGSRTGSSSSRCCACRIFFLGILGEDGQVACAGGDLGVYRQQPQLAQLSSVQCRRSFLS
jgi:hypothetical protein